MSPHENITASQLIPQTSPVKLVVREVIEMYGDGNDLFVNHM